MLAARFIITRKFGSPLRMSAHLLACLSAVVMWSQPQIPYLPVNSCFCCYMAPSLHPYQWLLATCAAIQSQQAIQPLSVSAHATVPADTKMGSVPMTDASASIDAERGRPLSTRCSRRKKLNVEEPKPTKRCPRASTRKSSSAFCSELSAAHRASNVKHS